jgi:hypothetical protein
MRRTWAELQADDMDVQIQQPRRKQIDKVEAVEMITYLTLGIAPQYILIITAAHQPCQAK